MSTAPDDYERSRAAVAVACLRWLQYSGPTIEPARPIDREATTGAIRTLPGLPAESRHPLWDRWLDG